VPTSAEIDTAFEEWWGYYPRKEDKGEARRAYARCLIHKKPKERATVAQLLAAVKFCAWPTELRYTKLPANWLRKGSWQHVSVPASVRPTAPPPDLDDRTGRLHAALEARLGAEVYGSWFITMRVESLEGERLIVSVAKPFLRSRIDQHYRQALEDAGNAAFGAKRVTVVVRSAEP
jgi:hypothetical protein